jgi:hypothetical protein
MAGCGGAKQVAQAPQQSAPAAQVDEMDAEIAHMERESKLKETKAKLDAAKRQREAERRSWRLWGESIEEGSQLMLTLCGDESMDKIGQWMGALGIGEHVSNERVVLENATAAAVLGQKFVHSYYARCVRTLQ